MEAVAPRSAAFGRILVALDEATDAKALADAVSALSRPAAEVTALHVGDHEVPPLLAAFASSLGRSGYRVEKVRRASRHPRVADDIVDYADTLRPDLVVIGSRGLSDLQALFRGSVTHRVLATSDCPVLVVRAGTEVAPPERILLAYDGSHHARRAAEVAGRIAAFAGAEIEVFHVARAAPDAAGFLAGWQDDTMRGDVEVLMAGLRRQAAARWAVEPAGAGRAAAIAAEAEALPADLVVMGSRGLSRIAGAVIGSVSHEVIHLSHRPVLLVP